MTEEFSESDRRRFEAGAAEAEAGYSVEYLRSLPQVRHPQEPSEEAGEIVRLRLDPSRIEALDRLAAQQNTTRAQIMRRAIDRELAG